MSHDAFLARQPIVDVRHSLVGYELLFRIPRPEQAGADAEGMRAGFNVFCETHFASGADWMLKGKLAFVNMDHAMLMSDCTAVLPPDKVIIDLMDSVEPTPDTLGRLAELKAAGFRIALDNFHPRPGIEKLLSHAAYIKLNMASEDVRVAALVSKLRRFPGKLVAERVDDQTVFERCQALGFDYFQGFYFVHPENFAARVLSPSHAVILQLMDKVRRETDLRAIENLFKKDVALTFKLLRYINSAGFGLSCEVQSIRHAISILGMQPLYRWLSLLLATAGNSPVSPALARTAITRGRLCELLGSHFMSRNDQDNLFITGVFSLLDAMLETPMENILERLSIPESVADALLGRTGVYGPILTLVEAFESRDGARLDRLTAALMLTAEEVNRDHLQALAWVEQLGLD